MYQPITKPRLGGLEDLYNAGWYHMYDTENVIGTAYTKILRKQYWYIYHTTFYKQGGSTYWVWDEETHTYSNRLGRATKYKSENEAAIMLLAIQENEKHIERNQND